jgi:hypothetical protein
MTEQEVLREAPCPRTDPHEPHEPEPGGQARCPGLTTQQALDAALPPPPPPEPDPDVPGLTDLIGWLTGQSPAVARAKTATWVMDRIETEVRDPAIVTAWEHRKQGASLRDLAAATGTSMARVTWALGKHPRTD